MLVKIKQNCTVSFNGIDVVELKKGQIVPELTETMLSVLGDKGEIADPATEVNIELEETKADSEEYEDSSIFDDEAFE